MQAEITAPIAAPVTLAKWPSRWISKLNSAWPMLLLAGSRASAVVVQSLILVVVGSSAGPAALGVLQLFTSWTCIAGEVFALGLPARTMRRVSVDYANGERVAIFKLLRDSRNRILLTSVVLGLLCYFMLAVLRPGHDASGWSAYPWLIVSILVAAPLFSLLRLYAEALKATGRTLAAVSIENLFIPVALLIICGYYGYSGQIITAAPLIAGYIIGLVIAPLALMKILNQQVQGLSNNRQTSGGAHITPVGDLAYLWACGILSITFSHLPFLIMPWFVTTSEVGIFAVAYKLVNIITTLLLLLAAVFGPAFARRAARQDHQGLLSLLRRTQKISTAVFLPACLLLIALSEPLAQLFGPEFSELRIYLLILSIGQLVNAATGLSGVLLNMAGAAHMELSALVAATVLVFVMSIWAGPRYGPEGLVLVFSGGIALKNITSYVLAHTLLKSIRSRA